MTDERKKAWSREDICKLINDLLIGGSTWPQIAARLKNDDVYIRRGSHGAQKKTWTAWSTFTYYKDSSSSMKLPEEDWPARPKAPKKAAPKPKKASPKQAKKVKKTKKAVREGLSKAAKAAIKKGKKRAKKRSKVPHAVKLPENQPAKLGIRFTDEGADVIFSYKGPATQRVRSMCSDLLELYMDLNAGN